MSYFTRISAVPVHRDNLVVEAIETALILLDDLRLERSVAVTRDLDGKFAVIREDAFFRGAVSRVAGVFTSRSRFLTAEMVSEFAF